MNRLAALILTLLLSALASGFANDAILPQDDSQGRPTVQATVPGDLLGWETDELNVIVSLAQPGYVRLEVYSPAFDPDDYRASLEGRTELGDERYDGGAGDVRSFFTLSRGGAVMLEREFGVAPHASNVLFEGELPAGEYHLTSSFEGLGKNTFVYTLESDPDADVFFDADATMLFNVRGSELQPVLIVELEEQDVPVRFGIYDGDGREELRGRLDTPSGPIELPISGDLEWAYVTLGQAGTFTFSFYQPEDAYQHSNTIGISTDVRLQYTPEALRVTRAAPVSVRIIDEAGIAVPGTYRIDTEGQLRTAILTGLPDDWFLVDTETTGGFIESPERVVFGAQGGQAVFVARRAERAPTLLTITALADMPDGTEAWPLELTLNNEPVQLGDDGRGTWAVTPGIFFMNPVVPEGWTIQGPASVTVEEGEHARAHFRLGAPAPEPVVIIPEPVVPEPEPVVEPEPEPVVVEPEPEPEPSVEPEPEPVVVEPEPEPLPVFDVERTSTVFLDFQAGHIARCELGSLEAGAASSLGLIASITDDALYSPALILPAASPDGVSVHVASAERDGDTVDIRVQVRNNTGDTVDDAFVLVPLPLGTGLPATAACGVTAMVGEELLISHELPAGAGFVPGSARLDGEQLPDPRVVGSAEPELLLWRVPYRTVGTLSYVITHEDALDALSEPTLTLGIGDREHQLAGTVPFSSFPRDPAAELAAGEAGLSFEPVSLVADGRSPLVVDIVLRDEEGNPFGDGWLSIAANSALSGPDATDSLSGYQVELVDGLATVVLEPVPTPFTLHVEALAHVDGLDDLQASSDLEVLGTRTGLYQAQVSVTASFVGGFELSGLARGYAELPVGAGTLQAAVDVGADSAGLDLDRSLSQRPDPTDRFPLTGAGSEATPALRSSDGVAALYTAPGLRVGYLESASTVPAVSGLPGTTGLHARAELGESVTIQGYAAMIAGDMRRQVIVPDGTRRYSLGESSVRGSETVYVRTGLEDLELVRFVDYTLDEVLGVVNLVRPLWAFSSDMEEVRLVVDYAPDGAARDQVAGGVGVRYQRDSLTLEVGAAHHAHLRLGVGVAWTADRLGIDLRYGLAFEDDPSLSGRASIRYAVTDAGRVELLHTTGAPGNVNSTTVSYSHRFGSADADRQITASVGVRYAWEARNVYGRANAELAAGSFTVGLGHEQAFGTDARSTSTASVAYRINPNLSARAAFELVWGNSFNGVLGLEQRVGNSVLELSYQLPTVSGGGNLARFGVRTPFQLSDNVYLDLHGGITRQLSGGDTDLAAGAALRYSSDNLRATLGTEVAHGSSGFKVVLRAGAAGQLSADQTLSFDANYQVVPTLEGRLSVAYALKRGPLNFLTYHRLLNRAAGSVLEGEVAPTLNFANRLQLRPNLAYRMLLDDPDGNAYQASLFAIWYLQPRLGGSDFVLGLGGGAHYLFMPALGASSYGFSAEVQARLVREVWLGVGYTFGGYQGLTADTRGGLYLRLDLVTGGQFE